MLNYLGQGAELLAHPASIANPFYALMPGWTLVPMVVLATIATVIASQAMISGTFTLVVGPKGSLGRGFWERGIVALASADA